jgi:hypothetical protein
MKSQELEIGRMAPHRRQSSWHRSCYKESIMNKSATTLHAPMPDTVLFGSMFRGIVAKVRNAVRIEIPIGYQDETGFHMGVKPAEKNIKWPSVW